MICCGDNYSIIYKNNGDLFVFGSNTCGQLGSGYIDNINVPTLLMNSKNIKMIYCSNHHSAILKNNNDLFICGRHYYHSERINKLMLLSVNSKNSGIYNSLIYTHNGDLFIFDVRSTLLLNDPSIIKINNQSTSFKWSPINHKYFHSSFKLSIKTMYNCLKRVQLLFGLKIPKFVIYEIIKLVN